MGMPKVVILAGGFGTRLPEYTHIMPKPMVEVGGYPILWHIMNIYAHHGFKEFVVAVGYKGEVIKNFFMSYYTSSCDFTVDMATGQMSFHNKCPIDWKVSLIDTGLHTMTGGRVKRLQPYLGEDRFFLTYGDGVSDIDIRKLLVFHENHRRIATISVVRPQSRFGSVHITDGRVTAFHEKPVSRTGWINGGFFVMEPEVFDYIESDSTVLERGPLERLAAEGQMMPYQHEGFWYAMDTKREVDFLNDLWHRKEAPWKTW